MRVAKAILEYLKQNDVKYIFGIPSGTVSGIYDELCSMDIKPIIAKNEAGAAYSAVRYAEGTGKLSVCIVAGGVGINNMLNGIADAYRAKVPVLIISGHVQRWQRGKGAIQEQETQDILKPITKHSEMVLRPEGILEVIRDAMKVAITPPMGPVHISIPVDIQVLPFEEQYPEKVQEDCSPTFIDYRIIQKASEIIDESSKGVIMVGRGCRGMASEIMELSSKLKWPIITTPEAKGVIPFDYELNLGNYGFSGSDAANEYVESDDIECVLVLGSSLGESSTRNYNSILVDGRKMIHIDWDPVVFDRVFTSALNINGDLKTVIPEIIKIIKGKCNSITIPEERNKPYHMNHSGLSLRLFFEQISRILPKETFYISDIGEYMNFVFKYLDVYKEGDFEISLNYGAMGTGVGGAVGTQLAYPSRPVAVFLGDGSFFMNGTEILTAKEYNLPIIYFIINNAMLGYVEHGQKYVYGRSLEEYKQQRISIASMMNAAGIRSIQINDIRELHRIKDFTSQNDGPCVIELITDGSEPIPVADRFKELNKKL